jgi:hypothetical protein
LIGWRSGKLNNSPNSGVQNWQFTRFHLLKSNKTKCR